MDNSISNLLDCISLAEKNIFWKQDEVWEPVQNHKFIEYVQHFANYFKQMGISKGSNVVLCLENSWKWHAIEISLQLNQAVVIGLEKSFIEKNTKYILSEISPALIITDDNNIDLKKLISSHKILRINIDSTGFKTLKKVPSYNEYTIDENSDAVMICTSGTTGQPKLITYTHKQVNISVNSICNTFSNCNENEKIISWLPLSHLFQRIVNRSILKIKGQIYFINNPKDALLQMKIVKPSIWVGVPKFYESVQNEIENKIRKLSITKKKVFEYTLRINQLSHESKRNKNKTPLDCQIKRSILNKFILNRINSLTGGNVKLWISGSAPLKNSTFAFWEGLNKPILQAYGVSECVIPIAMNTPLSNKPGSVGKPLDNVKIHVDHESEIYISSPGLCINTEKKSFGNEHFYNTGDLGFIDEDGFLFINGRKSEIIKMSNGKKVFPSHIESKLCSYPEIDQAFISGHGRNSLVALIYCISENLTQIKLQKIINKVNDGLEKYEQIKSFKVINKPFSIENDELTSNFKIRRHIVEQRYQHYLDQSEEKIFQTTSQLQEV